MDFAAQMAADATLVEDFLGNAFAERPAHADIYNAMNYSLLAGGKRLRPILTLEACRMCGGDMGEAMPMACAVEMIHTYSLIHDDLPCMDDDDLRRGRPTNHKVYGEATAILAGDGLLTAAFEFALGQGSGILPERRVAAAACLAKAAGAHGMVGGQALDMAGEGRGVTRAEVEELQRLKTGALICAAAEMGCIVAGGTETQRAAVRKYAQKLGLAFQVRDDMLDVEGDLDSMGKTLGSDAANEKSTFVSLLGLEACRSYVDQLTEEAVTSLDQFAHPEFLQWLATDMAGRMR
ncbi:MAG: polyprenyl synthetase family protein [Oscillospiraceae bacterium]